MRSLRSFRSVCHVILVAAFWLVAPGWAPAEAQERTPWIVVATEGQVSQQGADGSESPVAPGAALAEDKPVKTGADGKLVLAHGNDRVTVSANSAFSIPRDADPATSPSLLQSLGTLLFKVEHTPGRRFEIQAPYLAAVVKGTVFTVTASETGNSVHVAEGAVEVTSLASHDVGLVRPGQTALVSSAGRMSVVGAKPETKSENQEPGADGQKNAEAHGAETEDAGSMLSLGDGNVGRITQTLGDARLDLSTLTQGLVKPADAQRPSDGVAATPATTAAAAPAGTTGSPSSPGPSASTPVGPAAGPTPTSSAPTPTGVTSTGGNGWGAGGSPVGQAHNNNSKH